MESDVPAAFTKAHKILDSISPLCDKQDKRFGRLSKAETGWLLDTLMTYLHIDIKSSQIIELDELIIQSLRMDNDDLTQENNKLKQQLQEMRHYA